MAQKSVRRGTQRSSLMTPDPYHVPGYGGFCPQFKYQIGETFGRTTSQLLSSEGVAGSSKVVLAKIDASDDHVFRARSLRVATINDRTQSWGDKKLMAKMVPGYTGFIPKSQHYYGKRYAENCISAISDFETNQCEHGHHMKELGTVVPHCGTKGSLNKRTGSVVSTNHQMPLEPIGKVAKPYILKNSPQHTRSPYYMDNDNPDKRFVSGYTGFVPRSRSLIGSGYPIITHLALNGFTEDTKKMKQIVHQPIDIRRRDTAKKVTKPIYPVDSGLVPHYTGHIPGEKFRYGDTFGHSTKDALDKIRLGVIA